MANGSGFDNGPAEHADPLQAPGVSPESNGQYKKIAKVVAIVFAVIVLAVMIFS